MDQALECQRVRLPSSQALAQRWVTGMNEGEMEEVPLFRRGHQGSLNSLRTRLITCMLRVTIKQFHYLHAVCIHVYTCTCMCRDVDETVAVSLRTIYSTPPLSTSLFHILPLAPPLPPPLICALYFLLHM